MPCCARERGLSEAARSASKKHGLPDSPIFPPERIRRLVPYPSVKGGFMEQTHGTSRSAPSGGGTDPRLYQIVAGK